MKKIKSILLSSLLFLSVISIAQTYTATNLTNEQKGILENVKKQCNLSAEQYTKFQSDYILFLNENAKPNANTNGLLFLLGTKIKPYFSATQMNTITQMAKQGSLAPKNTTTTTTNTTPTTIITTPKEVVSTATGSTKSNVTELFNQLKSYLKVPADKSVQIIPILKDYDIQATKIKTANAGNAAKIKQEMDALNGQVVPKLKAHMTDQQLGTLVLAVTMQDNILNNKNLDANQQAFLNKLKNDYGLNETQTMSVILVMVQAKVRGDAITAISKTNPTAAKQELNKLLLDVDKQLKAALTTEQYNKIKADLEKMIQGK